jgi:hypothetical protein
MGQQRPLYFPFLPDHCQGYIDFFSESFTSKEPVVLDDGTSVQFPNGWTDEDADKWRKSMELQRPDYCRATPMDMVRVLTAAGVLASRH